MPYNIGDPGPAGGWIFATPNSVGNPTLYYFEVGPVDLAFATMPSGGYGMNCAGSSTWMPLQQPFSPVPQLVSGDAEFGAMKYNVQTGIGIGDGITNTQLLTQASVTPVMFNVAAQMCDTYSTQGVNVFTGDPETYNDWFLPSAREARLMMTNVGASTPFNVDVKFSTNNQTLNGINYPNSSKYWTSSAQTSHPAHMKARMVDSVTSITTLATRCHVFGVRPIRMFLEKETELWVCDTNTNGWMTNTSYPCLSINPLTATTIPSQNWPSFPDCSNAVANGACGGPPTPAPVVGDYNYRDGLGGVDYQLTPRYSPLYTPGLSGSGAHASLQVNPGAGVTPGFDNVGNDYRIKTTYLDPNTGIQHNNKPLTTIDWLTTFFSGYSVSGLGGVVGVNAGWDAVIGLPWFVFNMSAMDAMGNVFEEHNLKQSPENGYEITIWDQRKRKLGTWRYDTMQVCHVSTKYHRGYAPGSPLRNEHDMQCNNFPELCYSRKLRVMLVMKHGGFPDHTGGHHEYGYNYPVIQYGYRMRSEWLPSEDWTGPQGGPNTIPQYNNIGEPTNPILTTNIASANPHLGFTHITQVHNGLVIPSFGHVNWDMKLNNTHCNPNRSTVSLAYIKLKCDETERFADPNVGNGYANINGPNTDQWRLNVVCDRTYGSWIGANLTMPPHNNITASGINDVSCGSTTSFGTASGTPGYWLSNVPYITANKVNINKINCRNQGVMGKGLSIFAEIGVYGNCGILDPWPNGCIPGDPVNPCLYGSYSMVNLHPWYAQFRPGQVMPVPLITGLGPWQNIKWHNSLDDFVWQSQATPTSEPNMHCMLNTWGGIRGSAKLAGGDVDKGSGEDGKYIIREFKLNAEHIPAKGSEKPFSIVGDTDATFTLTGFTEDATVLYYDWEINRWTTTFNRLVWQKIGSTGVFNGSIGFPTETEDTIYNIQLMAEPHFDTKLEIPGVLSTITTTKKIYQWTDRTMAFNSSSDDHAGEYTIPDTVRVTRPPSVVTIDTNKVPSVVKNTAKGTISWTYTLKNDRFIIIRQPLENDFKSTITQTTDGSVSSSTTVKLDSITGLYVGLKLTDMSAGTIVYASEPTITAIDAVETSSTYKQITLSVAQSIDDGTTLTFTGYGSTATQSMADTSFSLNNLKLVLNDNTTTTTSSVSSSTTIPVTSTSGIAPKSFSKVKNAVTEERTIDMSGEVSHLGVGGVLVAVDNDDTITGTATITSVNIDGGSKKITFNEPVTLSTNAGLTFANTFIDSINICSTSKPYVDSINGSNLIASSSVTLDDGETLTFSGSGNSATVTSDIIITSMGESGSSVTLQLDNILKVS